MYSQGDYLDECPDSVHLAMWMYALDQVTASHLVKYATFLIFANGTCSSSIEWHSSK